MNPGPRVVLAGGGTGGHIYPLLALAEALLRRHPTAEVRFVGEAGRMEAELVPRAGHEIELLDLPAVSLPKWRRVLEAYRWPAAVRQVRGMLRQFRAEAVIGTGGQVCAAALWAARQSRAVTAILEPNAIPGRTNKLLAKHVRPAFVGVLIDQACAGFPAGLATVTGYPLRPEILCADRAAAMRELGLDPARRTLLVFGGSLGSRKINEVLCETVPRLTADWSAGWQILHLGGKVNAKTLDPAALSDTNVTYHYREYLHAMELALAAADLVLGRAGAMSLAELTALGLPAVLVPFPGAADDHQRYNAAWMANAGGAVVIDDAALTADSLLSCLEALLAAPGRLDEMAVASRSLGRPEAAETVVEMLEPWIERRRSEGRP